MPDCPRCHQPVKPQAIACPHCHAVLKAYGHPGVTLHRATGDTYLCDSCIYHEDDTCNFPQRPYAKECTLYSNQLQVVSAPTYSPGSSFAIKPWLRRNGGWLLLVGLISISILMTFSSRGANWEESNPSPPIEAPR